MHFTSLSHRLTYKTACQQQHTVVAARGPNHTYVASLHSHARIYKPMALNSPRRRNKA